MHAVKDAEWKADINDSSPHVEFVEFCFSVVVKLGTCTEGWHDPKLPSKEMKEQDEHLVNWTGKRFKGPMLYLFKCLYYSSQTPMERLSMNNDPKDSREQYI